MINSHNHVNWIPLIILCVLNSLFYFPVQIPMYGFCFGSWPHRIDIVFHNIALSSWRSDVLLWASCMCSRFLCVHTRHIYLKGEYVYILLQFLIVSAAFSGSGMAWTIYFVNLFAFCQYVFNFFFSSLDRQRFALLFFSCSDCFCGLSSIRNGLNNSSCAFSRDLLYTVCTIKNCSII